MGTSLTGDFWRLFTVLLVISMAITFVLSAVLDALVVRMRQRRRRRQPPTTTRAHESLGRRERPLAHR